MKKPFLIIYLIFISLMAYSQSEHINCTIFIDGKLPDLDVLRGDFSFKDSTQKERIIPFEYVIGEIHLSSDDWKYLHSLAPQDDLCTNLTYKSKNGQKLHYTGLLKIAWLDYRYIIIRITNLNKKRDEFYFGVSTPGISTKFIKQEYNMFEDY